MIERHDAIRAVNSNRERWLGCVPVIFETKIIADAIAKMINALSDEMVHDIEMLDDELLT